MLKIDWPQQDFEHLICIANNISAQTNVNTNSINSLNSQVSNLSPQIQNLSNKISTETNERIAFNQTTTLKLQNLTTTSDQLQEKSKAHVVAQESFQNQLSNSESKIGFLQLGTAATNDKIEELLKGEREAKGSLEDQQYRIDGLESWYHILDEVVRDNRKLAEFENESLKNELEQEKKNHLHTQNLVTDLSKIVSSLNQQLQTCQEMAEAKNKEYAQLIVQLSERVNKQEETILLLSAQTTKVHRHSHDFSHSIESYEKTSKSENDSEGKKRLSKRISNKFTIHKK